MDSSKSDEVMHKSGETTGKVYVAKTCKIRRGNASRCRYKFYNIRIAGVAIVGFEINKSLSDVRQS